MVMAISIFCVFYKQLNAYLHNCNPTTTISVLTSFFNCVNCNPHDNLVNRYLSRGVQNIFKCKRGTILSIDICQEKLLASSLVNSLLALDLLVTSHTFHVDGSLSRWPYLNRLVLITFLLSRWTFQIPLGNY